MSKALSTSGRFSETVATPSPFSKRMVSYTCASPYLFAAGQSPRASVDDEPSYAAVGPGLTSKSPLPRSVLAPNVIYSGFSVNFGGTALGNLLQYQRRDQGERPVYGEAQRERQNAVAHDIADTQPHDPQYGEG